MKAVIYARYSSDNQREASIEGQIRDVYKRQVQNSGGRTLSCYSDWNLFSSSLSYLWANFAPYKGKIPAHPLGRNCPLDGKKAAPHRAA